MLVLSDLTKECFLSIEAGKIVFSHLLLTTQNFHVNVACRLCVPVIICTVLKFTFRGVKAKQVLLYYNLGFFHSHPSISFVRFYVIPSQKVNDKIQTHNYS